MTCFVASSGIFTEKQEELYAFWITFVGLIGVPLLSILISDSLIVYELKKNERGSEQTRKRGNNFVGGNDSMFPCFELGDRKLSRYNGTIQNRHSLTLPHHWNVERFGIRYFYELLEDTLNV